MKKLTSLMMAAALAVSITACGATANTNATAIMTLVPQNSSMSKPSARLCAYMRIIWLRSLRPQNPTAWSASRWARKRYLRRPSSQDLADAFPCTQIERTLIKI